MATRVELRHKHSNGGVSNPDNYSTLEEDDYPTDGGNPTNSGDQNDDNAFLFRKPTYSKSTCIGTIFGCFHEENGYLFLSPEYLRILVYASMILTLSTGVIVSKLFANMKGFPDATMLTRMYGYNNVCLYVDFAPSNLVVPYLWGFVCMFTGLWALVIQLRYQSAVQAGYLSPHAYHCLSASSYVVVVGFVGLSICLAFPPTMDIPERLILHTIPYQLWTFSLCTLAISQTIYGMQGYWARIRLPWMSKTAIPYCVLLLLVAIYKQVVTIYGWVEFPMTTMNVTLDARGFQVLPGAECTAAPCAWQMLGTNTYATWVRTLGHFVDILFVLCGMAAPLVKTLVIVCCRRKDMETVCLRVMMTKGLVEATTDAQVVPLSKTKSAQARLAKLNTNCSCLCLSWSAMFLSVSSICVLLVGIFQATEGYGLN